MNPAPDGPKVLPDNPTVLPREAVQRWRLVLARGPIPPEAAQREQLAAWEHALAASGLPVAGLDAAKARPRFALAAPLGASIPGEAELADVWLVERLAAWRVREALAASMPSGWRLVDVYDVWLGEAALPGRVVASVYRATLPVGAADTLRLQEAASRLLATDSLPRERRKGETVIAYDLRPFLDDLVVEGSDAGTVVRMTLRHDPEKGVGRPEEVLAALGERTGGALPPATVTRACLVLGEPPAPPPAAPRRRPAGRVPGGPARRPGPGAPGAPGSL